LTSQSCVRTQVSATLRSPSSLNQAVCPDSSRPRADLEGLETETNFVRRPAQGPDQEFRVPRRCAHRRRGMVSRMLVLAHRGANRLAPENTQPAMPQAVALGADGVELDVHRSADGALVVRHD